MQRIDIFWIKVQLAATLTIGKVEALPILAHKTRKKRLQKKGEKNLRDVSDSTVD